MSIFICICQSLRKSSSTNRISSNIYCLLSEEWQTIVYTQYSPWSVHKWCGFDCYRLKCLSTYWIYWWWIFFCWIIWSHDYAIMTISLEFLDKGDYMAYFKWYFISISSHTFSYAMTSFTAMSYSFNPFWHIRSFGLYAFVTFCLAKYTTSDY